MASVRAQFAEDMEQVGRQLLDQCGHVETMLGLAMQAVAGRDLSLVEEVKRRQNALVAALLGMEEQCVRLIALQQPVGRDIRFIATALKVVNELERCGDHCAAIARIARKRAHENAPPEELFALADLVRNMLKDAMVALVTHDLALVEQVLRADTLVDKQFHALRDIFHDTLRHRSDLVVETSYLLFAIRDLACFAEHVITIAERIQYVETGELKLLDSDDTPA